MSAKTFLHSYTIMTKILAAITLSVINKSLAYDDSISCHNTVIKDDLPSADYYSKHFFPEKSIFFIESSCKGGLDSRQACSIESAAKVHTHWQINVLFAAPVPIESQNGTTMKLLRLYKNIKFLRIHAIKFAEGTPLASILESGILDKSQWQVLHSSDVYRFLTLYKWAGVYLDLDIIVVKSFGSLDNNWVAKLNYNFLGSAHISTSSDTIGRMLADTTIRELETNLRIDDGFNYNGPLLLTRVMGKICTRPEVSHMTADSCKGIAVYEEKYFFHYGAPNWYKYFNNGDIDIRGNYAIHTFNGVSETGFVSKQSPYAKLAEQFCPKMYRIHQYSNWKI